MYLLYGSIPSLFTRKLEAALEFYRAPFEFRSKGSQPDPKTLELRAGTHQVPLKIGCSPTPPRSWRCWITGFRIAVCFRPDRWACLPIWWRNAWTNGWPG